MLIPTSTYPTAAAATTAVAAMPVSDIRGQLALHFNHLALAGSYVR